MRKKKKKLANNQMRQCHTSQASLIIVKVHQIRKYSSGTVNRKSLYSLRIAVSICIELVTTESESSAWWWLYHLYETCKSVVGTVSYIYDSSRKYSFSYI